MLMKATFYINDYMQMYVDCLLRQEILRIHLCNPPPPPPIFSPRKRYYCYSSHLSLDFII